MARQGSFAFAVILLLAYAGGSIAGAEQTIYGEKQKQDCDGTVCSIGLGKAGKVKLPAMVALKTAHSHYVSVSPPNGGEAVFTRNNPQKWEEWDMVRVGDRVAFKSHHGTFLSQRFHPADGFEMASEMLAHELFEIVEPLGAATEGAKSTISVKGHNGLFLSSSEDDVLRQEVSTEPWEMFVMHKLPGGKIALRSAHGSYLSATAPKHYGVVMQQESFNAWETFVLDSAGNDKLTLETPHKTFVSAHADEFHHEKVFTSERAVMWELWTPYINATSGVVCLQAHDGRFLIAHEDVFDGVGLAAHCMEHEQFEVVVVTEQMLSEARKREEAKRAAALAEAEHGRKKAAEML